MTGEEVQLYYPYGFGIYEGHICDELPRLVNAESIVFDRVGSRRLGLSSLLLRSRPWFYWNAWRDAISFRQSTNVDHVHVGLVGIGLLELVGTSRTKIVGCFLARVQLVRLEL